MRREERNIARCGAAGRSRGPCPFSRHGDRPAIAPAPRDPGDPSSAGQNQRRRPGHYDDLAVSREALRPIVAGPLILTCRLDTFARAAALTAIAHGPRDLPSCMSRV